MKNRAAPRCGFTILELLIVIAIIAVLMSILIPSLSRVRQQARLMTCVSNEKQLYAAAVAFAADNEGHLPCPPYIGEDGKVVAWKVVKVQVADFSQGTLMKYLSDDLTARKNTMWCPSDQQEMSRGAGSQDVAERNFSYSMSLLIRPTGGPTYAGNFRLAECKWPAQKIMIYEEFGPNDGVCYGNTDSDDWISGRHGGNNSVVSMSKGAYSDHEWRKIGKSNQCYFDGHVELMTVEDYFGPRGTAAYGPLK